MLDPFALPRVGEMNSAALVFDNVRIGVFLVRVLLEDRTRSPGPSLVGGDRQPQILPAALGMIVHEQDPAVAQAQSVDRRIGIGQTARLRIRPRPAVVIRKRRCAETPTCAAIAQHHQHPIVIQRHQRGLDQPDLGRKVAHPIILDGAVRPRREPEHLRKFQCHLMVDREPDPAVARVDRLVAHE